MRAPVASLPRLGARGTRGPAAISSLACPLPHIPIVPRAGRFGRFDLNYCQWGSKSWPTLDLAVKPGGCGAWCNRARRWLSGGHYAVEQLLELVQREVPEFTHMREEELARQV